MIFHLPSLALTLCTTLLAISHTNIAIAFAPQPFLTHHTLTSLHPTSLLLSSPAPFDDVQETPGVTRARIQSLVDTHSVLLFMKGSQVFPQCGFSSTAVQILNTFGIEFHSVDILADEAVRQGVKDYSQWPTIPQLYVAGEFVGGSDIMIEMYQNGELAEMIEKAKADML